MNNPTIEANICEINNGPYYPVKLHTVPHVGEQINLYSFIDQVTGYPSAKDFEVVRVTHELRDVSEKVSQSKDGYHMISVWVKPWQGEPLLPIITDTSRN